MEHLVADDGYIATLYINGEPAPGFEPIHIRKGQGIAIADGRVVVSDPQPPSFWARLRARFRRHANTHA